MTEPGPGREASAVALEGHGASAVALAYRDGASAPRVVAKGRGLVAEEIIRRAQDAGVYVHESRELVSLLLQLDLDEHIPARLYVVVAELLAWVWQLERRGTAAARP